MKIHPLFEEMLQTLALAPANARMAHQAWKMAGKPVVEEGPDHIYEGKRDYLDALLAAKDARIRELEAASKNKDYCIRTADERLAEKSKYISGLEESLRRAREQIAELEAKLAEATTRGDTYRTDADYFKDRVAILNLEMLNPEMFGGVNARKIRNAALEEAAKIATEWAQWATDSSGRATLHDLAARIRALKKP